MHDLFRQVQAHWAGILLAVGIVLSPAVATMPERRPCCCDDWWTWFRDYSHQLSNSRNPKV